MLLIVPVGNKRETLWAVSKVEGLVRQRAQPSEFILLVSFSGNLLVVLILSMIAICGHFCSPGEVINSSYENYGGRLVGCVQSGKLSA